MKTNNLPLLVIGLLSACSSASTLLWVSVQDRRVDSAANRVASSTREVKQLTQNGPRDPRVPGLEGQLDGLNTRVNALESLSLPGEPETPRAAPPSDEELAARLDTQIEEGGADPSWTASAEQDLQRWGEALPAGELGQVRCGASLCRFQLGFDDDASRASIMNALPNHVPWDGEGFAVPVDEDGLVYEVYLAREGASLGGA